MSGVKENALKLIDAYNQMAVALVGIGSVVIEYNYKVETVSDLFDLLDGGELK